MSERTTNDVLSRPVLVGVGADNRADHAVRVGLDLASRFGTQLELLHVLDAHGARRAPGPTDRDTGLPSLDDVTAAVARQLDSLPGAAGEPRPSAHLRVLPGRSAPTLVEEARRLGAGLIVLGSHRRRGFIDFGSTTRSVLAHAPCAVWNQVEAPRAIRRILVPVDLSEDSRAALALARGLARRLQATITALHCYESPDFAYSTSPDLDMPTYVVDHQRREALEEFERFLAADPDDAIEVAPRFFEGEPARTTLALQGSCDLIVMATHGHGALSAAVLGGVTNAVLREAHVPVVAARHPARVAPAPA